jgi:hypothetical protein
MLAENPDPYSHRSTLARDELQPTARFSSTNKQTFEGLYPYIVECTASAMAIQLQAKNVEHHVALVKVQFIATIQNTAPRSNNNHTGLVLSDSKFPRWELLRS